MKKRYWGPAIGAVVVVGYWMYTREDKAKKKKRQEAWAKKERARLEKLKAGGI